MKFPFRNLISRRLFLFGSFFALSVVAVFIVNTAAVLAAQQADPGSSQQVALAASATPNPAAPAPSSPDPELASASQASATPAQSPSTNATAPQNQPAQSAPADSTGQQTKRILGIVPNFRAVSADTKAAARDRQRKIHELH